MMTKALMLLAPLVLCVAALSAEPPPAPSPASRLGASYLGPGKLPDSVALLAPPPAEGSKQWKRDKQGEAKALKLHGTARWDLATADADLFTPKATGAMSCAAGFVISNETTPKLDALLRKAAPDLGLSAYGAKQKYMRARPFMGNGKPMCTPEMDATLRKDGSYPSGHAAIGYGWGLILADIIPSRKKQLLARGRAFADSRRVCNVHFLSDIEGGEKLAVAVVALLAKDAAYQADVEAAKAEVKAITKAQPDCAAEKAALRLR